MVSMELPTERWSVDPAGLPQRAEVNAADCALKVGLGVTGGRRGIPLMQVGSVGAVVTLGLLGGTHSAQAAVRRGASCEAIDQLQAALGDRGYDVGSVDGQFGWRTEAAVRRFQQQQNLLADGVVGPATARAMGLPPEFSCASVATKAAFAPESRASQGNFSVATNGAALRLRTAPAGSVVGALKNGTPVTVIETANGWAKLRSGAWVSRAWLQVGRGSRDRGVQDRAVRNRSLEASKPSPSEFAQSVPIAVIPAPLSRPESASPNLLNADYHGQAVRVSPGQTSLEAALPGNIIQLPSSESAAQIKVRLAAVEDQMIKTQVEETRTIEAPTAGTQAAMVTALPLQAAVPSRPLRSTSVSLNADQAAAQQTQAKPAVLRTAKPLMEETAFIQAMSQPSAVAPTSRPVTVLADTTLSLANAVASPRRTVSPNPVNSRALLAATAASNSLDLPSAIAPESSPLRPSQRVVDPASSATGSAPREITDEISGDAVAQIAKPAVASESVIAESIAASVRSTSQLMEVATYGDRLLIRDRPSGQVIGSIPNGLQINTVAKQDGWYELETGGWVMARWLRS